MSLVFQAMSTATAAFIMNLRDLSCNVLNLMNYCGSYPDSEFSRQVYSFSFIITNGNIYKYHNLKFDAECYEYLH